jgi:CDP-glucose 4,6-dehydratase
MEKLALSYSFWKNKSILITGHTGFKGGWLSLWLNSLGAQVHGYALAPSSTPSFFKEANIESIMASHTVADIRDVNMLESTFKFARPEIVFHLAAQPLVRESYIDPVETFTTNVVGTINLFEMVRKISSVRAVINVTTDKCYENKESLKPFVENDSIGGYDPYAASKGCSELITASYRQSFLAENDVALASARAGNVIGGGDWSKDRLIPDFLRALDSGEDLIIRSPDAIRPWQHVLEPLKGYLQLGEKLITEGQSYAEAWNFGPSDKNTKTVEFILKKLNQEFPQAKWDIDRSTQPYEAHYLALDSTKANKKLKWQPRWKLDDALDSIISWHHAWHNRDNMQHFSLSQINDYEKLVYSS